MGKAFMTFLCCFTPKLLGGTQKIKNKSGFEMSADNKYSVTTFKLNPFQTLTGWVMSYKFGQGTPHSLLSIRVNGRYGTNSCWLYAIKGEEVMEACTRRKRDALWKQIKENLRKQKRVLCSGSSINHLNRATNCFHGSLHKTPASWKEQQPLFSVIGQIPTPQHTAACLHIKLSV